MAKKTERVVIDGVRYEITQLGAEAGRGLYKKFVTAIGPLLREVVSGNALDELQASIKDAGGDVPEAAEQAGMKALQLIVPLLIRAIETLPDALFEELCQVFAESCEFIAGKATNGNDIPMPLAQEFDDHFAGDYVALTQWLGHCIRVNGFLGKGLRGFGAAKQAKAAA
jgi:hypothetical protein